MRYLTNLVDRFTNWLDTINNELTELMEENMNARIANANNRFILLDGKGEVLGTYVRRRDAVRGAKRRGFVGVV